MRCPFCGKSESEVLDSREAIDGNSIRRRRMCSSCKKRFTTYEKIDLFNMTVIKKDNTREGFDRNKILDGIIRACEKRPIGREKMEAVVAKIERDLRAKGKREVGSREIGDRVIRELLKLDPVAYIRFASVYHNFESPNEFRKIVAVFNKDRKRR